VHGPLHSLGAFCIQNKNKLAKQILNLE